MIYSARQNAHILCKANKFLVGFLSRDRQSYTYKSFHRSLRNSALNRKSESFIKKIRYLEYFHSEKRI
jgi:hypothetical protein